MDWYYAEGKERRGPIDDAQLNALISGGTIKADTLVWNQTMPNWQTAAAAGAMTNLPPGVELCIITGRTFPTSQMIKTEHGWVSAEGRDTYYQSLREGVPLPSVGSAPTAFADGQKIVVLQHNPRLPMRCVKTNQPLASGEVKKKTLYWCTPWVFLSILLSLLVVLILYLIFRKKVVLEIPLSAAGKGIVRKHGFISAGVFLAGLGFSFSPAFMDGPVGGGGASVIILGILCMLGSLVYAGRKANVLRVTKIHAGRVWLAGAGPEYLASLPPYMG